MKATIDTPEAPASGSGREPQQVARRSGLAPYVSVIVPVFGPPELLAGCLDALERQSYPSDRYEVLVVDNGATRRIDSEIASRPHCRAATEPRAGSYCARNTGVRQARGEVLAFTDADCVPDADWLRRGVAALDSRPERGMVAGRIRCTFRDPARPGAVELYESVVGFRQKIFLERWGFAATANLLTWRSVFDRMGPFDEQLRSGGDLDWGQRVRASGLEQAYADDAVVDHPARASVSALLRKASRVAGGLEDLARKRGEGGLRFLADAAKDLLPLRVFASVWDDERLRGARQKVAFVALSLLVGLVRVAERLRVRLGGVSRRS